MHHHPVEPARGEDGVEQDDGLGTEADEIAYLCGLSLVDNAFGALGQVPRLAIQRWPPEVL